MSGPDPVQPATVGQVIALSDRDPRRAVRLARQFATAAADKPWALFALGWALLCAERFAEARQPFSDALAGFTRASDCLGFLQAQRGLLTLDQRTLARPKLDEAFAELADRFVVAGDALSAAQLRLEQARQLNILGRPLEAAELLGSLAPALAHRLLDTGRLRRALAVATAQQGAFAQARALLAEAEELFRRGRFRIDLARCWLEQASLAVHQERLAEALHYYGQAERVFTQFDLPLQRAFCAQGSGLAQMRQGRYDEALRQTLEALQHYRSLGRLREIAECTINLGNIHWYTGRWEGALAAYIQGEGLAAQGGFLGTRLIARRNRAMVYHRLNQFAVARNLLDEAEQEATALGYGAEIAEIWSLQAALFADEGRVAEAYARYGQAYEQFKLIENHSAAAECRLQQGCMALTRGDRVLAAAMLAVAEPELLGHPHHRWRLIYCVGRLAEGEGQPQVALTRYVIAGVIVAGLRRRLASEAVSSSLFSQAARLYADALRLAARLGDGMALLAMIEEQRALTLWRLLTTRSATQAPGPDPAHDQLRGQLDVLLKGGAVEGLDEALAAYHDQLIRARHVDAGLHSLGELFRGRSLDLPQVRTILSRAYGTDWTALVYALGEGSIQIACLTAEHVSLSTVDDTPALRRLIDQASLPAYRRYTYRDVPFAQGHTTRPWDRLRALSEQLLPPEALQRLRPEQRLIIVPSGPLHRIPWAALRLERGWLVEHAIIDTLPSLSLVPLLAERRSSGDRALLIGCGQVGARAAALPQVYAELELIASRWPGEQVRLVDAAATHTALLDLGACGAGAPAVLHLACHAQQLPARGLAAHIKLSDKDLLLSELVSMELRGTVVVLSACEGAAADVLPGEEVLSLSWGFLAAGARGIIASLWPMDDAALPALMALLYAQSGLAQDPARALALAQRAALAQAPDESGAPELWGSFIVTGGALSATDDGWYPPSQ